MTRGDWRWFGVALALGAAGAMSGSRSPRRRRFPRFTVALALVIVAIGSVLSVLAWSYLNDPIVVNCQGVVMAPDDICRFESGGRYQSYVARDYEEQHAYLYGWRRAGLIAAICLTAAGVLLGVVRVGRWLWLRRGDAARASGGAVAAK